MPNVPQVRRVIFNDEEIGMGFNSASGLAVGTALESFTVGANPDAGGMEVTASITIVNSHEELMENLGMSFEAQGRYGFYSGSAKAKFSESSNFNTTSTFLIARCLVENPLKRGKNFKVTAAAQGLLNSQQFDEFKKAFGDSFVRGLQTGGEFYAVIRITSVSTSTQSSLAATLQGEANGLVASGSFKVAFETASSSASTRSEFTATMFQKAGSGAQIAPTVEISEVISRFKQFPSIASASAAAYETEVATYDTIPLSRSHPGGAGSIPDRACGRPREETPIHPDPQRSGFRRTEPVVLHQPAPAGCTDNYQCCLHQADQCGTGARYPALAGRDRSTTAVRPNHVKPTDPRACTHFVAACDASTRHGSHP